MSPEEPDPGGGGAPAGTFPDRLPTLREAEERLIAEAFLRADGHQGVADGRDEIT